MEPKQYSHTFRETNWVGYPVILFGLLIVLLGLYGAANDRGNAGITVIFWLLGGLVVWQGRKIATHKQPLLQFGPAGIWTPTIGFMPWKDIRVSIESVSGFGVGVVKSLVIMQRKPNKLLDTVALMSLGPAEDEVVQLIKEYTNIDSPR